MSIITKLNRITPICFIDDQFMLVARNGVLYKLNISSNLLEFIYRYSYIECLFPKILLRFFRLGIRYGINIGEDLFLIEKGHRIHELDLKSKTFSKGAFLKNSRALNITIINNIKGFDECVVFGEYMSNAKKENVKIYKRLSQDFWEPIMIFEANQINHIHNIVPDKYKDCVWVLTGDFGEAAAIWKMTDNFTVVERVFANDQKYRACVAYATSDGLLYASDTPFADNFIYIMKHDGAIEKIFPIAGSCIYGAQLGDKYVFSSTVEADGRDQTMFQLLLSCNRGQGIKDDFVHLYMGNVKDGFKEVYKDKKDMWSFIFQFGVFKFPTGLNNTCILYFHPIATLKNDLGLVCFNADDVF